MPTGTTQPARALLIQELHRLREDLIDEIQRKHDKMIVANPLNQYDIALMIANALHAEVEQLEAAFKQVDEIVSRHLSALQAQGREQDRKISVLQEQLGRLNSRLHAVERKVDGDG